MDFKSYYFDTIRLRNELMARLGEYLTMPKKLDDLETKNDAMLKSISADVKANALTLALRLKAARKTVEAEITSTQKLANDVLAFKDTVEKNPDLSKLITGDTGIATFAINALLNQTLTSYKPFLDKIIEYSKASLAAVKNYESINSTVKTLEKNINDTYNASVTKGAVPDLTLQPDEAKLFGLPKPAVIIGGLTIAALAAIMFKRKK